MAELKMWPVLNGTVPPYRDLSIIAVSNIYDADPFGNRAFYEELFGEETVNNMTNTTGETADVRDVFPRVTFREIQDAEMVAECLRNATIGMGKKAAQAIKVWGTQKILGAAGLPSTIMDGANNVAEPYKVIREIAQAITEMLDMIEAVAGQLANMYRTPDDENTKYLTELHGFITETRDFVDTVVITADEYNKKTGE